MSLEGFAPGHASATDDPQERRFATAVAGSTGLTVVMLLAGVHGHVTLPTVDLVLDTTSLLAAAALMALAWFRYRESGVAAALYQTAAFGALVGAYAIAVIVSLAHGESAGGLASPEDAQALVFAVAQFVASALFVASGWRTNRPSYARWPMTIVLAPGVAVLLAAALGYLAGPPMPALAILLPDAHPGMWITTPLGGLLHIATAAMYFAGAFASRRLWRNGHAAMDGWLAIGLVLAGFGELHWTLYPSAHPGQVSTGDIFRLGCALVLLVGLESAVRTALQEVRDANAELGAMRELEVQQAALEERARLARELHDGLAQDLWLARIRTDEAAAEPGMPDGARRALEAASAAIGDGLGEAREAVSALRGRDDATAGFVALVRRSAEEQAARFGVRAQVTVVGDEDQEVGMRVRAEVLRILREAMANAVRHGGATIVGIRLNLGVDRLALRVADNGHGFDRATIRPGAFGLESMRQRAELVGGRLRVVSSPGSGTGVVLVIPMGAKRGGGRAAAGRTARTSGAPVLRPAGEAGTR